MSEDSPLDSSVEDKRRKSRSSADGDYQLSEADAPPPDDEASTDRRSRWPLIRRIAGVGALVLVGTAVLILWPLLWPADPDASIRLVDGRLLGETSGYVARIDLDGRTVDVSPSLVGWRPVVLVVNEETVIRVQDRLGALGDLWKDRSVRVSYEVLGNTRLAKSIEIVTSDPGPASLPVNNTPAPGIAPSAVAPPEPSPRAADPPATPPALDATPIPARVPSPPDSLVGRGTSAQSPPRPTKPAAGNRSVTRTETQRPVIVDRPPKDVPPQRSAESDAADGTAAIDWLFNQSRRP